MKSANPFALRCSVFLLISGLYLVIAACDKFTIPRIFENEPVQQIPAAVTLVFEQAFLDSTLAVDGCGYEFQVPSGKVLSETFVDVSQQSFANVSVQRGDQTPMAAPTTVENQPSIIIHLRLVHQLYETPTRFGEEDTYKADLGFQVLAVYTDISGNILAQRPLTFKERVSIWAPQDTSTPATCNTHQFEGCGGRCRRSVSTRYALGRPFPPWSRTPTTNDGSSSGLHATTSSPPLSLPFLQQPRFQPFLSGHCSRTGMII